MQLTDLSDECRSRIEDFDELLVKLGRIPDKNTLALPYVIADHGGSPSRQNTEEDENPLTVFQDQGKLKEKQRQEEEQKQLEDRI